MRVICRLVCLLSLHYLSYLNNLSLICLVPSPDATHNGNGHPRFRVLLDVQICRLFMQGKQKVDIRPQAEWTQKRTESGHKCRLLGDLSTVHQMPSLTLNPLHHVLSKGPGSSQPVRIRILSQQGLRFGCLGLCRHCPQKWLSQRST